MQRPPSLIQRTAIGLLPALTGMAIPFVHLYLLNKGNLTLPLSVHLPWLALLTAILFGIFLSLQVIGPGRLRAAASLAVLALGVFTWAESTLLIGDFGFLQGMRIEWSDFRHLLYLELLLAAVVGFSVLRFSSAILDRAVLIAGVLTISALANLYPAWQGQRHSAHTTTDYTFTQEQIYDLSRERNVLLYVIDTFQADLFAEIIANEPEWRTTFTGFTYFPNALAAFPKTYTSVPNLLTGRSFDNTQPYPGFQREAYFGNSLPRVLKQHSYDVRFMSPWWQPYLADPAVVDNVALIGSREGRTWMERLEFVRLFNLTIFRVSPFLAKPWAYNDNEFRIRNKVLGARPVEFVSGVDDGVRQLSAGNDVEDLNYHDRMMAYFAPTLEQPAFRVFHLNGLHAPLTVNRNLEAVGDREPVRENLLDQAEGMLELLSRQFDRLREIGAFDNSTIIVVGDHGAGGFPKMGVNESALAGIASGVAPFSPYGSTPVRLVRGAIPLVLVKPAGAQAPLEVSIAPVQLGDVPNTVFAELGFDEASDGPSMMAIAEDQERVRIHRYYEFSGWRSDYIVPLIEYDVEGFSWDPGAWSKTGRNFNAHAVDSIEGQLIVLGEDGNLEDLEHSGWEGLGPQGRWLGNQKAEVRIPVEPGTGPRELEFCLDVRIAPEEPISLLVSVNGETIEEFKVSQVSPALIATSIPAYLCDNLSAIDVSLELASDRPDSLCLIEIRVQPAGN